MKKPLNALRLPGWLLVAALGTGPAWAAGADAPPDARKARHDAACAFIVDEVQRLDRLVERGMGEDVLVEVTRESGASLFRRQAEDLRIDYFITADGRTIVSRAEMGPKYIGKRLTATSLRNTLRLTQDLPPTWQTGCDRLELTVRIKGAHVIGMTIEADVH